MATETVTLVIGQTWSLVSAAGSGPFDAHVRSGEVVFHFGDSAPAADYEYGLPQPAFSLESIASKVWARTPEGAAVLTCARTEHADNVPEIILPAIGLSSTSVTNEAEPGDEIATITNRIAGDRVEALLPEGERFVLSADRATILRGTAPINPGDSYEIEIETSHPQAPNSPRRTRRVLEVSEAIATASISGYPSTAPIGVPYEWLPTKTGGNGSGTWSRTGDALPAGFIFSSTDGGIRAPASAVLRAGAFPVGTITYTEGVRAVSLNNRAIVVSRLPYVPEARASSYNVIFDPQNSSTGPTISVQRHADLKAAFAIMTTPEVPRRIRYAISRAEDNWNGVVGNSKRSEHILNRRYGSNELVRRSYTLTVEGANPLSSSSFDNWLVFGQMHYVPTPEVETSGPPPIDFSLEPDGMHVHLRTATAAPVTSANLTKTTVAILPVRQGRKHHFVMTVRPGQGGAGVFKLWMDGVQYVDITAGEVGFPGSGRQYYWKEGVYAGVARPEDRNAFVGAGGLLTATYDNSEISTGYDLEVRIDNPLPIADREFPAPGLVDLAPVTLLESFEHETTSYTLGNAAFPARVTSPRLQGAAALKLEGIGSNASSTQAIVTKLGSFVGDPSAIEVFAWAANFRNRGGQNTMSLQFGRNNVFANAGSGNVGVDSHRPIGWKWYCLAQSKMTGMPTGPASTDVRLRVAMNAPYGSNVVFDGLFGLPRPQPKATIRFDDNEDTGIDIAASRLEAYGWRGTWAVNPIGNYGVGVSDGHTWEEYRQLDRRGHALICSGTMTDLSMTTLADAEAARDSTLAVKAACIANGISRRGLDYFYYPNAHHQGDASGNPPSPIQIAAMTGNGSNTVTFGAPISIEEGMTVEGSGVPLGTVVASGSGGTNVQTAVLSNAIPAQTRAAQVVDYRGPFENNKLPAVMRTAGFKLGCSGASGTIFDRFGYGDQAMLLPSQSLTGADNAKIDTLLDDAKATGSSIHFVIHRIVPDDTATVGINITVSRFEYLLSALAARGFWVGTIPEYDAVVRSYPPLAT